MINEEVINSPIRWAGSKKKLLNEMLQKTFKKQKKNYVECFLGSGVVLLNVLNNQAYLGYEEFYVNDINKNIINFYKLLRDNSDFLIKNILKIASDYNLKSIEEKEIFYYDLRKKFNEMEYSDLKAIYFYLLMKIGFNGVYRENSKGEFNVPFGRKNIICVQENYLKDISSKIQCVEFYNMTFEEFLSEMNSKKILDNAFVYCDPPYLPDDMLVYQKQMLYTKESFNHEIFFNTILELKISNIMISMSESKIADKIYYNPNFEKIDICEIIRVINPKKLFSSKEIAFINYKLADKNGD